MYNLQEANDKTWELSKKQEEIVSHKVNVLIEIIFKSVNLAAQIT